MDLPAGTIIREGMDTASVDFRKLFPTLRKHRLTGYVALDLLTNNGIEEGILVFNEGEPIAAGYEYIAKGQSVNGEDALRLFMNACAGDGRFDIYELTSDELAEARTKNRDSVFRYKPTEKELLAFLPDTFTENYLEEKPQTGVRPEAITKAGGISREEVLKKYNIAHPDPKMLDKLLAGIMDGAS